MRDAPLSKPRLHVWVSNAVFTRLTGVKKVCVDCGAPSNTALKVCPGKRPDR